MNNHDLKHTPRVAALRKKMAKLHRKIRNDKKTPRPSAMEVIMDGLRAGFRLTDAERKELGQQFDIRTVSAKNESNEPPAINPRSL